MTISNTAWASRHSEIAAALRELITRLSPDQADAEVALRDFDSLGLVELIVAVEDRFQLEVPDTELSDASFVSVDALSGLINRLMDR